MHYDPSTDQEPVRWLAADELDRITAIQHYHKRTKDRAENPRLHAIMHHVVENQLAEGVEVTQTTLDRLCREGLSRHEAIHAIGSVVAEDIFEILQSHQPHDQKAYAHKLEALVASEWRSDRTGRPSP